MPRLFVIMPFGVKSVVHGAGESINFDDVYRRIIRAAGESSGWVVVRIDELTEVGPITDQYLREIFAADLVLADISAPNANVFYELGIRQAISPGGTILIAHKGTIIPFDLSSQRVLFYDLEEVGIRTARIELAQYLHHHASLPATNPVRTFLEQLGIAASPRQDAAGFERELNARIERSRTIDQLIAVWHWVRNLSPLPVTPLLSLAERLSDADEWMTAAEVLRAAASERPDDFEINRQLGWYLQHLGPEHDAESVRAFERALALNPHDPETLGMMGGRLKRLGQYAEAAAFYNRAAIISPNSLYILVNQAAMPIMADPKSPEVGIKKYKALAERVQRTRASSPDEWSELVLGEAFFAIGELEAARAHYASAITLASSQKSLDSAAGQLELFAELGFRSQEALKLVKVLRQSKQPDIWLGNEVATVDARPAPSGLVAQLPLLVHLSDVHFGSIMKDGREVDMHRFYEGENSQPLSRHIIEELTSPESRLTNEQHRLHLIVSGDLTYTAVKSEFDKARHFIDEVCSAVGIGKERVHIIPGNHDVNWSLARIDKTHRFDNYINFLVEFYGETLFRQKYPRIKWPLKLNDPRPQAYEIVSVSYDSMAGLLMVGFNSCVFETEQHHYGFIGERQLRLVRELLQQVNAPRDCLRVGLIHHHLHPFPEVLSARGDQEVWLDLSTIRDAGHVERYLERLAFDLVLHGHKHKAQIRETLVRDPAPLKVEPRPLIICGAGSVSCTELEHNEPNHYEIIEVRRLPRREGAEFLRVEWRIMPVVAGAEWSAAKIWDIRG